MKLSLSRFNALFITALALVVIESVLFGSQAFALAMFLSEDVSTDVLLMLAKDNLFVFVHWYALVVINRNLKTIRRSGADVVSISEVQKVILVIVLALLLYADGTRLIQLFVLVTVDFQRDFAPAMDEENFILILLSLSLYFTNAILLFYGVSKLLLSSFIKTTIRRNSEVVTLDG
ncbi:hypothetical protein [Phaeocystidibacter luteus]|uniref:Uncharacterized protein n=1 Tax=Phaeocystidibacter luteus TaxID=911197 RepID=A0A6N6RIV0_9FLAO|nr:hypothetical protein [Phaeocystidibacter luteus]KAB2810334.1 hypothetical protein F8C67_07035 [Phaeocystidibacter luteus]